MIEDVVIVNNFNMVEEVIFYIKVGGGCVVCYEGIEDILVKVKVFCLGVGEILLLLVCLVMLEVLWLFVKKLLIVEKIKKIEEVFELVCLMLQCDYGDVELVDVQGKKIYVYLKGVCFGCMMEVVMLGGIQQKMIEVFGELVQVLFFLYMLVEV